MEQTGVLVVGSINADLTAFTDRLPAPGETVAGTDFTLGLGGKGANQAVAAARFGAPTWMVGCVGEDAFADLTLADLAAHGVHTDQVRRVSGATGVAHIRVDAAGQNDIVSTPLANSRLSRQQIDAALTALRGQVGVLLLQFEVPAGITAYAARAGRAAGLTVILDPAPAVGAAELAWADIDVVTPNESEAALLTGAAVTDPAGAEAAGRWFVQRGVGLAVITLGGLGAVTVSSDRSATQQPFAVPVVDTTAAGDAFTGTLGSALAQQVPPEQALRYAMAAGALAVTKAGAGPALPARQDVLDLADAGGAPGRR